MLKRGIFLTFIAVLLFAGCQPQAPSQSHTNQSTPWVFRDVRTLDPVDAMSPEQDILALYVRRYPDTKSKKLEIRLDFLALTMRNNLDLYFAIDHQPGGTRSLPIEAEGRSAVADIPWDTLLVYSATRGLLGIDNSDNIRPNLELQLWQDTIQDTITLSLNSGALATGYLNWQIQVFSSSSESNQIVDNTKPISLDAPPPAPAAVLFAFWNTFPGYTPAQSLRRWSGAHTGPLGGSHGLAYLLRASQRYQIPLILLDLKTPISLSALDYVGGLSMVREMEKQNLLILPDYLPADFGIPTSALYQTPEWLFSSAYTEKFISGYNFELPASQFLYGFPQSGIPDRYIGIFSPSFHQPNLLESVSVQRSGQLRVIPISTQLPEDQATLDGPSMLVREALVNSALTAESSISSDVQSFIVLGGDLTQSTWGEFRRARATFEYIHSHPWIKPLAPISLLTMEASQTQRLVISPGSDPLASKFSNQIEKRNIAKAAWQTYQALNSPVSSNGNELVGLRLNYLGQVNTLLTVSDWESNPRSISSCLEDPDRDGEPECVLASKETLLIFEIREGSLSYAFVRTSTGVHQAIGPTSQLAVGLSPPEEWDLNLGEQADPSVIMGAFKDSDGPYFAKISSNNLILSSEKTEKTFALTPSGLMFRYFSLHPEVLQVPIILDPWELFQASWGERYALTTYPNGLIWQLKGGVAVDIKADTPMDALVFTDTRSRMGLPENPNFDYPPGHYLPFPLALIRLHPKTEFQMTLTLRD